MADIQKISGVDKGDVEKVSGVAATAIENVSGHGLVTFTDTTYTINASDNSWAIPTGTNHIQISLCGGGTAGRNSHFNQAGGGGPGAGTTQNAKSAIGNITSLAITIAAAMVGQSNNAGGANSSVTGTGLTTMTANGGGVAYYGDDYPNNILMPNVNILTDISSINPGTEVHLVSVSAPDNQY